MVTLVGSDVVECVPCVGRNVVVRGPAVELGCIAVVVIENFVVEIIGSVVVYLVVTGGNVIVVVSGTEVDVSCVVVVIFGFVVPEVVVMIVEVV